MTTWVDLVAARSSNPASPSVMLASTKKPEYVKTKFITNKTNQTQIDKKQQSLRNKEERNKG